MSKVVSFTEFMGTYGFPRDLLLRMIHHKLVSFKYIALKLGGSKNPYIIMDRKTWSFMHSVKRNHALLYPKDGLITWNEARIILFGHGVKQDAKDFVLTTVKYPKCIPQQYEYPFFIAVDKWFMEYAKYHGYIHDYTVESVVKGVFDRTISKLLITY